MFYDNVIAVDMLLSKHKEVEWNEQTRLQNFNKFYVKENLLNLCPKPHSVTDYNIPKYSKVLELRPPLWQTKVVLFMGWP